jgi:hypothetical protein
MLASGTKLLGASTGLVLVVTVTAVLAGAAVWAWLRVRHGEAPFVWQQRRRPSRRTVEDRSPGDITPPVASG